MTTQQTDSSTARPLAVVTGASSGIGRALADELAGRGFDLVVAADEDRIEIAAHELSPGAGVTAVQVDLATAAGVEELHRRVGELGRPVAVAALNAGIAANGRFDRSSLADDLRVVDLNVRSVVHLAKLLVRDMLDSGEGRLLITSSVAAVAPGPYQATYSASKAFVHSFAVAIGHELKDTGVTVTSLMPGPTDTDFFARADMEDDTRLGRSSQKDDPADVAKDAVDALLEGRSSVVAGSFVNRIQAELGTHLPDALAAPLLARLSRPDGE